MENHLDGFIQEITKELETGITAGNILDIARNYGLEDSDLLYPIPGFPKLYYLWGIKEEAARAFIDLINSSDDYTMSLSPLLVFICGGSMPVDMPFAKKVYNYKKDHILPVYFEKRYKT